MVFSILNAKYLTFDTTHSSALIKGKTCTLFQAWLPLQPYAPSPHRWLIETGVPRNQNLSEQREPWFKGSPPQASRSLSLARS